MALPCRPVKVGGYSSHSGHVTMNRCSDESQGQTSTKPSRSTQWAQLNSLNVLLLVGVQTRSPMTFIQHPSQSCVKKTPPVIAMS